MNPALRVTEPTDRRREIRALYESARKIAAELLRHKNYTWGRTDLAHEALSRLLGGAWSKRVRDQPREAIRALRTVVRRTLIDYERSRRRACSPAGLGRRRVALEDAQLTGRNANELEGAIERAWLLDRIRQGATELQLSRPDAVLEVAELALLFGRTQREIADHTGVPQTTVSSWLRMIRAWLRTASVLPRC